MSLMPFVRILKFDRLKNLNQYVHVISLPPMTLTFSNFLQCPINVSKNYSNLKTIFLLFIIRFTIQYSRISSTTRSAASSTFPYCKVLFQLLHLQPFMSHPISILCISMNYSQTLGIQPFASRRLHLMKMSTATQFISLFNRLGFCRVSLLLHDLLLAPIPLAIPLSTCILFTIPPHCPSKGWLSQERPQTRLIEGNPSCGVRQASWMNGWGWLAWGVGAIKWGESQVKRGLWCYVRLLNRLIQWVILGIEQSIYVSLLSIGRGLLSAGVPDIFQHLKNIKTVQMTRSTLRCRGSRVRLAGDSGFQQDVREPRRARPREGPLRAHSRASQGFIIGGIKRDMPMPIFKRA